MAIYILSLFICLVLMIVNFWRINLNFQSKNINFRNFFWTEKNKPSIQPPKTYISEPDYDPLDLGTNLFSSRYNEKLFYKISYRLVDKMPRKLRTKIDVLLTKFYGKEFLIYFVIFVLIKISIITFFILELYFVKKIVFSYYVFFFFLIPILLKMLYFISILHKIWIINYYSTLFIFKSEYPRDSTGKEYVVLSVLLKDLSKPEFAFDLLNQKQFDIENNNTHLNEVSNTWVHCQCLYKSHKKIKILAENFDPIINFICLFFLFLAILNFII